MIVLFLMAVVVIKSRRDSPTQEDIWACAEHINRNKYHERMKPQERQSLNADFIDPPIKCVYGVKCIRADCDPIAFNSSSLAESALKQNDTEMFLCCFIQKAVTHIRASSLVFVTFHRPISANSDQREQWYVFLLLHSPVYHLTTPQL